MAESEDIQDRTMRVEVDLPNSEHVLRHGMWGRAEIILEKATKNLTVPSSCILDRDSEGKGAVQVVRDGRIYKQAIQIGRDDGVHAEILSGLEPDAQVVLQPDASLADGTQVKIQSSANSPAGPGDKSGEGARVPIRPLPRRTANPIPPDRRLARSRGWNL